MRMLLLFIPFFVSAQLTTTPKLIFKSANRDTVSVVFTPSGAAILNVRTYSDVIDDNVRLEGIRQHDLFLDTAEAVIASATGTITYKVYRKGVDVTPAATADNSLTNIKALLASSVGIQAGSLTAAQVRAILAFIAYKEGILDETLTVKKLKFWAK